MDAWDKANAEPFPGGQIKFVMSPRFASRYDRTMASLAEYQAAHDGEMPPDLHEIFGEGGQP